MFRRFEKSYEIIKELNGSSLLDIGCGPGTHDVAFASLLNIQVTGIDFASSMIELARKEAEKSKVKHLCNFIVDDFITFKFTEMYDAAFAVGVVEYITDPGPFIKKMFDLSRKKVLFSLPVKFHYLTPQRILRYKLRKCPLHFYSKNEIENLLLSNGMQNFFIHNLGRDYLIEVNK
jgi:cyclopropane fatty-acyl-phospholipid synthase-like methyltransferase